MGLSPASLSHNRNFPKSLNPTPFGDRGRLRSPPRRGINVLSHWTSNSRRVNLSMWLPHTRDDARQDPLSFRLENLDEGLFIPRGVECSSRIHCRAIGQVHQLRCCSPVIGFSPEILDELQKFCPFVLMPDSHRPSPRDSSRSGVPTLLTSMLFGDRSLFLGYLSIEVPEKSTPAAARLC